MKALHILLTASFLLTGAASAAEPIVSEEELKTVLGLVEQEKERCKAGLITMTEVLTAERIGLRAQYWAGKITREDFAVKAEALHGKLIQLLKEQIAAGTNKAVLLQAYGNLFEDRRLP